MNGNDDREFMKKAHELAQQSNCIRKKVGAVIVLGEDILIGASNGTPNGMTPCNKGGCERCHSEAKSGEYYDSCLCVHAEQSAIATAAGNGISIHGSTLYCTLRPCVTCVIVCLKTGIFTLIYDEDIGFSSSVETAYEFILKNVKGFTATKLS
jgi:dCMP deaminase